MARLVTRRSRRIKILLTAAAMAAIVLFGIYRLALHRAVAHQLQEAARQIPGCTGLDYASLRIPYFSLQCEVRDAVLRFEGVDDAIGVRSFRIRRFRPGKRLPRTLEAAVHGLALDARQPVMAPLRLSLEALEFTAMTIDGELRWVRRGKAPETWQVALDVRVPGAGRLSLTVQLAKVDPQGVALALENPVNWFLVLPAVELVAVRGRYENGGLAERALKAAARRQDRPPEQMRRTLSENWRTRALAAQDPSIRAFWQALADFIPQPEGLIFQTRLTRPLPLGRLLWMRTPGDWVRGLALEVKTENARTPVGTD